MLMMTISGPSLHLDIEGQISRSQLHVAEAFSDCLAFYEFIPTKKVGTTGRAGSSASIPIHLNIQGEEPTPCFFTFQKKIISDQMVK